MEQIRELWDRLTQPADAIRPNPRTQFQTFEGWGTSDEYSSDMPGVRVGQEEVEPGTSDEYSSDMAIDTFDSLDAASRGD